MKQYQQLEDYEQGEKEWNLYVFKLGMIAILFLLIILSLGYYHTSQISSLAIEKRIQNQLHEKKVT